MSEKGQTSGRTKRIGLGALAMAIAVAAVFGVGAFATFTSNPQTSETHGHAGTIGSTVTVGTTSISYATAGLSGYASCVEAPYGPLPTTDVVVNFTNVAPGDNCTWTATLTNTGSLPGHLSASLGLSVLNVCATATSVNCYLVGNSLGGSGTTIAAGGTYAWSGYIELAPGSTTQGLAGEAIWNAYESIGA